MQVLTDLKNNLLAQVRDPKKLLFLLFITLLMVDFIARGRLGYVGYASWHIQNILKGSDWQFIIIVLLLIFKK
jgi:hypothetical protein